MILLQIHPEQASTTHATDSLMEKQNIRTPPLNSVTRPNQQSAIDNCSEIRILHQPLTALMDGNFTHRLSRV